MAVRTRRIGPFKSSAIGLGCMSLSHAYQPRPDPTAAAAIAVAAGCTPAQLALGWVLAQGEDVIPIPGTGWLDHLEENAGAEAVRLDAATLRWLDELINPQTVAGPRYNAATQADIDTEELPPWP